MQLLAALARVLVMARSGAAAAGTSSASAADAGAGAGAGSRIGQTPALGWLSWQHYRCNRDCKGDPGNCFNEDLIKRTADLMVSEGYAAAGYKYISLDDCWQAHERVNGHVISDPVNFPSGISALADYVHSKGLLLGIYTALGNGTCAMGGVHGLPRGTGRNLGLGCDAGSLPGCTVAERDINDFISWGIDALKVGVATWWPLLFASRASMVSLLNLCWSMAGRRML
jgi:hypothetical protein